MKSAVVLLSGGLDSATVLYEALHRGYHCSCLIVDYGQRHRREIRSARAVARAAACPAVVVKVRLPWAGSALTDRKIPVPLSRSLRRIGRGIPSTYVPARNTIFLSLALGFAEAKGAEAVFIGANALDYSLGRGAPILVREKGYVPIEDCKVGDTVLTMNPKTLKLEWLPITCVLKHPYTDQPMYRLVSEHGRELIVSGGHSVYGLDETGVVRPVQVQNLQPGDYVVAAGRSPRLRERMESRLDLAALIQESKNTYVHHPDIPAWIGRPRDEQERSWKRGSILPIRVYQERFRGKVNGGKLLICTKTRGRGTGVPASFNLTEDWAFFFGLWLADGSYSGRSVQISCGDPSAHKVMEKISSFFKGTVTVSANKVDRAVHSRILVESMRRLGFQGTSRTKIIPPIVQAWPGRLQAAFIKGYIVGDGSIDGRGPVTLSSVNPVLLRGFNDLLLQFGIVAYLRTSHFKKTNFSDSPVTVYNSVIENSNDKKVLLDALGEFEKRIILHPERSKIHGIPAYRQLSAELKSFQVGHSVTKLKNAIRNNALYSKNRFHRNLLNRLVPFVPSRRLSGKWKHLSENDILFVKVRSKERVHYRDSFIYDLSIAGNENFLSDGIVAHNSGYPDCRPAYYRIMQKAARLGTKAGVEGKEIRIITPLIRLTKAQIIRRGRRLGVPYEKTWSCYLGGKRPCRRCDSCLLRAKGFQGAGLDSA